MTKHFYGLVFLMMTLFYSSCAAIEGIFKAGMYTGIIVVVIVVAIIFWIIAKVFRRK